MFEEKNPIFEEENQQKLIKQIQTAPDTRIFGINPFNRKAIRNSQIMLVVLTIISSSLVLLYYKPIISEVVLASIILAAIILAFILSYLKYAHDYTKIYVNSLGVAKQCVWDQGAIPWEELEYIEIKHKGDEIEYIIFRSGILTLAYRNVYFIKRLTLEVISEYIGGIESWNNIHELKEDIAEITKSDTFYMRPDLDIAARQKKLEDTILMEWIGEQDYDASTTEEQTPCKSDEDLFALIMDDPQRICIKDTGKFTRTFAKFKTSILMMIIAVALTFIGIAEGPFSWLVLIVAMVFYILIFYGLFHNDERLFLSPIGIVRYYFGSPDALEWKHVEFIDFHANEESPVPFEFFGNNNRVYCPKRSYHELLTMDHILRYLPELNQWKKVKRASWEKGTFRLIRPEM